MTKEQEALLNYANNSGAFDGPAHLTLETIAEQLGHPDWYPSGPYIPISLREVWEAMPLEAKVMARILAHEMWRESPR